MDRRLALVLLALLGIAAGLLLRPAAPEVAPGPATSPTRFAPAPNAAASAGAAAPTRTPALVRQLQVVDRDTQLPLAYCGLRLQQRPARTDARGTVTLPSDLLESVEPGGLSLLLEPREPGCFEPVRVVVGPDTEVLLVDANFRVRLQWDRPSVVRVREVASGAAPREGFEPSVVGAALGPPMHELRAAGDHWLPATAASLVLEVEGGTVSPAHLAWRGPLKVDEEGWPLVTAPTLVTPATISDVFDGLPGSSHDFELSADPLTCAVVYTLAQPCDRSVTVELYAVRGFGAANEVTAFFAEQVVPRGQVTARFEGAPPGAYVVVSAVLRGDTVDLASQRVQAREGQRISVAEAAGAGPHQLWLEGAPRDAMVIGLECGRAASYPAFELGAARALRGLHSAQGSVVIIDRSTQEATRHRFDVATSARLRLGRDR